MHFYLIPSISTHLAAPNFSFDFFSSFYSSLFLLIYFFSLTYYLSFSFSSLLFLYQVESLGGSFLSVPYVEDGSGAGGYAKEMSAGYKEAEVRTYIHRHTSCTSYACSYLLSFHFSCFSFILSSHFSFLLSPLHFFFYTYSHFLFCHPLHSFSHQATAMAKWVSESDIVITTALIPGRPAPKLISATMLEGMKPGSGTLTGYTGYTVYTVCNIPRSPVYTVDPV